MTEDQILLEVEKHKEEGEVSRTYLMRKYKLTDSQATIMKQSITNMLQLMPEHDYLLI